MSWTDRLLPASFRGQPFKVQANTLSGGRATVLHEMPYALDPVTEDLGRKARRFSIEAFVLGDDYIDQRDNLLRALERNSSPGRLIHPTYGEWLVRVEEFRVQESSDRGRMCTISIDFVEHASLPQDNYGISAPLQVDDHATKVQDAAQEQLTEDLVVDGASQPTIDATANEVGKIGKALAALGSLSGSASDVAALASQARTMILQANALALAPIDLGLAIRDAIDLIEKSVTNAIDSLDIYRNLSLLEPEILASSDERSNAALVILTARLNVFAGWARALNATDWPSYDEAVAARREWETVIEADMLDATGALYSALSTLEGTIAGAVPPPDRTLPRVTRYVATVTVPAIALAARLYDDVSRAPDIVARNRVRNPLLVPGGTSLEVLTRE